MAFADKNVRQWPNLAQFIPGLIAKQAGILYALDRKNVNSFKRQKI